MNETEKVAASPGVVIAIQELLVKKHGAIDQDPQNFKISKVDEPAGGGSKLYIRCGKSEIAVDPEMWQSINVAVGVLLGKTNLPLGGFVK